MYSRVSIYTIFIVSSLAKVAVIASTASQGLFILFLLSKAYFRKRIDRRIFYFYFLLFFTLALNFALNGLSFYAIKNLIYIILLPYVFYHVNLFERYYQYIVLLIALTILWYIYDPSSYLTREFGSFPRFIGPFINPNVSGLSMLLLILIVKNSNDTQLLKVLYIGILSYGVYLTNSKTSWILLPICFMSKRQILLYGALLISLACVLYFSFEFSRFIPSLLARVALWTQYTISDFKFFGSGFDTFGAGLGTVNSKNIAIIDSFYISAGISGGIMYLLLIIYFFFVYPFLSLAKNDRYVAPAVAIMAIACFLGNFLENGFPANAIFISILMHFYDRRKRV